MFAKALLGIALSLTLSRVARAEEKMKAGLWEVTATVEVPGLANALPPTSQTECLSQKDVDADPLATIDKGPCRATHIQRTGGKVSWDLSCTGSPAGQGHGEIELKSSTLYEGWMVLETGGTTLRTTLKARRIGDC